ncbi:MAG: class II glutamine amidotransferase [Rhodospirillales bacterium]|nr:class II glutamine amidotransferase [Rhodospirillales bacterium]
MCRFLAYHGAPVLLEDLVASPSHSLIRQSLHALESRSETNGDGFGIGWYGERARPGLYREVHPAWSDENLLSICAQVRSHLFFAHVRAATGTATMRANCHPFAAGKLLFMHNGQIGGWQAIRRRIEALIPDTLYAGRIGTTDTEALFLAALARGLEDDPPRAMAETLGLVLAEMTAANIGAALRLTAALTDGETIWAFRWASDDAPPTLYYHVGDERLIVVSEPIDERREEWRAVPPGSVLTAAHGRGATLAKLEPARP